MRVFENKVLSAIFERIRNKRSNLKAESYKCLSFKTVLLISNRKYQMTENEMGGSNSRNGR
jgi:hypothetical protein